MFVEGLRADSLYLPFANVRVSQLLSFLLFLTGVAMLIVNRKKVKISDSENTEN